MKALSVRQPWASLIVHGFKDIENRTWQKTNPGLKFRGEIFIHASSGMTKNELEDCEEFCRKIMTWGEFLIAQQLGIFLPYKERNDLGGIVGRATVSNIITESSSPWFFGKQGLVMTDAKPLPFVPFKGQLGFFNIEDPY